MDYHLQVLSLRGFEAGKCLDAQLVVMVVLLLVSACTNNANRKMSGILSPQVVVIDIVKVNINCRKLKRELYKSEGFI